MTFVVGRGRYARATYPVRRGLQGPPGPAGPAGPPGPAGTPGAVARIWTPVTPQIGFNVSAPTTWEPITDGFIALTGHGGGAILGSFSLECLGTVVNADNFNIRVVLGTSGGDVILPMQAGDSYSDSFLGSATLAFWAAPPGVGVTYDYVQTELFCGGNGGNLATVWNGQLSVQEVTFS